MNLLEDREESATVEHGGWQTHMMLGEAWQNRRVCATLEHGDWQTHMVLGEAWQNRMKTEKSVCHNGAWWLAET